MSLAGFRNEILNISCDHHEIPWICSHVVTNSGDKLSHQIRKMMPKIRQPYRNAAGFGSTEARSEKNSYYRWAPISGPSTSSPVARVTQIPESGTVHTEARLRRRSAGARHRTLRRHPRSAFRAASACLASACLASACLASAFPAAWLVLPIHRNQRIPPSAGP